MQARHVWIGAARDRVLGIGVEPRPPQRHVAQLVPCGEQVRTVNARRDVRALQSRRGTMFVGDGVLQHQTAGASGTERTGDGVALAEGNDVVFVRRHRCDRGSQDLGDRFDIVRTIEDGRSEAWQIGDVHRAFAHESAAEIGLAGGGPWNAGEQDD